MPKRKVKVPEPDFVTRTISVFYLDKDGKAKSGGYRSFADPTEAYKKKRKNIEKSCTK